MCNGKSIFDSKLLCFLLNTTLTPKEKLITPKKLDVQKEGERHKVDCIDVESDSTIGQNNLSQPKIKHFIKISILQFDLYKSL